RPPRRWRWALWGCSPAVGGDLSRHPGENGFRPTGATVLFLVLPFRAAGVRTRGSAGVLPPAGGATPRWVHPPRPPRRGTYVRSSPRADAAPDRLRRPPQPVRRAHPPRGGAARRRRRGARRVLAQPPRPRARPPPRRGPRCRRLRRLE